MGHGRYYGFANCPACRRRLDLSDAGLDGVLKCLDCGKQLVIAQRYLATTALICFAAAWTLPYLLGLRGEAFAYLMFAWIPLFVLFFVVVSIVVSRRFGPILKIARPESNTTWQLVLMFIGCWLACWITAFVEVYIFLGGLTAILGTERDLTENLAILSAPLCWANQDFVIGPGTNLFKAFGIVGFNSFFYAVPLFAAYRIVRAAHRRSRPLTLGLSSPPKEDQDS